MMTQTTDTQGAPVSDEAVRDIVRDYKEIRADYAYNDDILTTDPSRLARVKWIIENKLSQVDQTLILLYVDCQSLRKLGERLGISHTRAAKEIRRIRETILAEYEKIKDKDL